MKPIQPKARASKTEKKTCKRLVVKTRVRAGFFARQIQAGP